MGLVHDLALIEMELTISISAYNVNLKWCDVMWCDNDDLSDWNVETNNTAAFVSICKVHATYATSAYATNK